MGAWIWIVLLVAAAAALLVINAYALSHVYVFHCKACGGQFRIPWRRALYLEHVNRDYKLACPHCGKKGWCHAQYVGKEEKQDK